MTQDDIIKSLQKVAEYFYDGKVRNLAVVDACEKAINKETGKEIYKHSVLKQPAQEPLYTHHPFCNADRHKQIGEASGCICMKAMDKGLQPAQLDLPQQRWSKEKEMIESWQQPAQEPVAWIKYVWKPYEEGFDDDGFYPDIELDTEDNGGDPLYTHPAPSWQGLTAKEIASIPLNEYTVQTVEKMLRNKNNG